MPELPDVELYKRYLDEHALHQTIERAVVNDARILDLHPNTLRSRMERLGIRVPPRHGPS